MLEVPSLDGAGLVAGGVSEHVEVVGLSGDASASGAVVGAVVEVVLPDTWDGPSRAVRGIRTAPADRVA